MANKILVVGPSWVGDMVMAQSLFIDLKQRLADCQIDVLAPTWTAALTDRMPQVKQLITAPFEHGKLSLGQRIKLGRQLRQTYQQAIVLPHSLKSALVPAIARIPVRTGFVGEQRYGLLNDIRRLNKSALPMTVQRFVALGREKSALAIPPEQIPAPSLNVNPKAAQLVADRFVLNTESKILALCPGAEFGPSKQWPVPSFAETAQYFIQQGWRVWLFGSDHDCAPCQQINQQLDGQAEMLAGRTSLPEAVDLLALCNLVISNDSGLMHIAAGLNRPLVAVYGSTDPYHTPPLSHQHRIAQLNLDCAPCFERQCPLQHHHCMQQLSPKLVIDQAEALLGLESSS